MKLTFVLTVLLAAFVPTSRGQEQGTFPTDEEIQLLLTQTDRAMQQYKPLIDEEERQLGKAGTDTVAKDRQVVKAVETAVQLLTKQPQGFNGPVGFSLFEWLDDATRNALLCSQGAMSQSTMLMIAGKTDDALRMVQLSKSCMDASTLIYTVSENAGSLYERYVKGEQDLANEGASGLEQCVEALKKTTAGKKP
jgi:hypothetical protein